ncbi:MAG: hypothetical protein K6B67_05795 [Lachnospiraceae bacterium]|nr:hypothetical protein [Lachnospiraceae bacterium]
MAGINSSIISFKDRGNWGDSRYRGNCSGYVHKGLIEQYNVKSLGEVFAGSGTGSDVCKEMGIDYLGLDLNPNPIRPDIISGFNVLTDDIPDAFYGRDMIFMHPPYGAEINIPYAGSQWNAPNIEELKLQDLGQMPWDTFMYALNYVVMKFYTALDKGSRMAILMGDVKRKGKLYSMLTDIVKIGELEQIIIKAQHNCWSDNRTYSNRNFVPIEHEYIMVLKKASDYIMSCSIPKKIELDIRDSQCATWQAVVRATLQKLGGEAKLDAIYNELDGRKKCENCKDWKAKVRQTLQYYFASTERGVWKIA